MKCKVCGGAGVIQGQAPGLVSCCPACDGKGFIEQTNEEWIHTLNTEQLAEFLADKCNEVVETVLSDASCDIGDIDNDDYWYRRADFVEWLKQPYTKE
jgi:RecJ-like exonuclease